MNGSGAGTTARGGRTNTVLAWAMLALIAVASIYSLLTDDLLWAGFTLVAGVLCVLPAIAARRADGMLPWEVLAVVAIPLFARFVGYGPLEVIGTYISAATLALVVAVLLHSFTTVAMPHWFAVLFVTVTTMALAGVWAVVQWAADVALGTGFVTGLYALMWGLTGATAVGLVAGVLFDLYFKRSDRGDAWLAEQTVEDDRHEGVAATHTLRDRLGISERRQHQITRGAELALVAILLFGLAEGSIGVIVNALIGLVVVQIPGFLERDYSLPVDAGLALWVTVPIVLHAIGTLGPYQQFWWWDEITHTLSSSLVAAAGYTTLRAIDKHADDVYLPPQFTFVFLLLFVVAFGVLWEILEFGADGMASLTSTDSVLAQYSVANTMGDLVFDTVGGVIVAIWGTTYLGRMATAVAGQLDARESK